MDIFDVRTGPVFYWVGGVFGQFRARKVVDAAAFGWTTSARLAPQSILLGDKA